VEAVVIGGPASNGIDNEIAKKLNLKREKLEHKIFPDGESYIRYPIELEGKQVIIVQSLYPPQDKHLVELLLALDAAKDLGAAKVIAVVPYLAYSRQDRRFRGGEAVSIKTVLKALRSAGADALITVDVHKEESLNYFEGSSINVLPLRELVAYFEDKLSEPLVIAPDKGAVRRAREAANILNCPYDYLEKSRNRITGEVSLSLKGVDVRNRDVLIVDDIISTGGTMALASRRLRELGARRVFAACTHALLRRGALKKLVNAGVHEVVATNTVPSEISKVSVASAIAEALRKLISV